MWLPARELNLNVSCNLKNHLLLSPRLDFRKSLTQFEVLIFHLLSYLCIHSWKIYFLRISKHIIPRIIEMIYMYNLFIFKFVDKTNLLDDYSNHHNLRTFCRFGSFHKQLLLGQLLFSMCSFPSFSFRSYCCYFHLSLFNRKIAC